MSWLPKQNVVVPCDFSDESITAIDTALEMVGCPGQVHVIHVLPELSAGDPGVVWGTIDDGSRRDHATAALENLLSDEKYQGVDIVIAFGSPGHEIVEYAQTTNADLLVMPSHGRTGITRLLIGSVAERVVRLSHCPVLVLRQ